ncbi:hypothetical protein COO60DRAFT_1465401 [Scenedesmus sp. NREL 46B-D3]|nr:hypothetical protein COO60DRAFT_1465401 [Scenedesmus sp. NREL 46B-D3]
MSTQPQTVTSTQPQTVTSTQPQTVTSTDKDKDKKSPLNDLPAKARERVASLLNSGRNLRALAVSSKTMRSAAAPAANMHRAKLVSLLHSLNEAARAWIYLPGSNIKRIPLMDEEGLALSAKLNALKADIISSRRGRQLPELRAPDHHGAVFESYQTMYWIAKDVLDDPEGGAVVVKGLRDAATLGASTTLMFLYRRIADAGKLHRLWLLGKARTLLTRRADEWQALKQLRQQRVQKVREEAELWKRANAIRNQVADACWAVRLVLGHRWDVQVHRVIRSVADIELAFADARLDLGDRWFVRAGRFLRGSSGDDPDLATDPDIPQHIRDGIATFMPTVTAALEVRAQIDHLESQMQPMWTQLLTSMRFESLSEDDQHALIAMLVTVPLASMATVMSVVATLHGSPAMDRAHVPHAADTADIVEWLIEKSTTVPWWRNQLTSYVNSMSALDAHAREERQLCRAHLAREREAAEYARRYFGNEVMDRIRYNEETRGTFNVDRLVSRILPPPIPIT